MEAMLRSWWQQIKQRRGAIFLTSTFVLVLIALIIAGYWFNWTGFNGYTKKSTATDFSSSPPKMTITEEYQPGKSLWDWATLFIVPGVLALGVFMLNQAQQKRADKAAQVDKQRDKESAEQKATLERESREDNQRETAFQTYIDKLSELLLHEHLRDSAEEDEVRTIARARTLTILPQLDAYRQGSVLQILYESHLIDKNKPIVDLHGVRLDRINLQFARLENTCLRGITLEYADLSYAKLAGADLSTTFLDFADLTEANLSGANLSQTLLTGTILDSADLSDTNLKGAIDMTPEQLEKQAKSLKGATMPDGSIHP